MKTTPSEQQTPTGEVSSHHIDSMLNHVERIYHSVTGHAPAESDSDKPYANIPPEKDPGVHVAEQMERLLGMLGVSGEAPLTARWAPPTTVSSKSSAFVIDLDLAGVQRDDVRLAVNNNLLSVEGERRSDSERGKNGAVGWSEIPTGRFSRTLLLPPDSNAAAMTARMRDGMLTIEIPRAPAQTLTNKNIAID